MMAVMALSTLFTARMLKNGVKQFITFHYQAKLEPEISKEKIEAESSKPSSEHLRLLFLGFLAIPQAVVIATQTDPTVTELLSSWLSSFANWQQWLSSPPFLGVLAVLSLERICYTIVWTRSKDFLRFCKMPPMCYLGSPVDVVVSMFFVNKCLQISVPLAWYFNHGQPPALADISNYQWVTAVQCFFIGQLFNYSIYQAIGKNGVYYGARLGATIPWCEGYPFNVVPHPQYAGVVLSIYGLAVVLATQAHVAQGWFGMFAAQVVYYSYMGWVENNC